MISFCNRVALQIDILSLLTTRVRPEFLIFSVIVGYLVFLFFFYTKDRRSKARRHWDSLQWGDRILIGFLLGATILLLFSVGLYSLIDYVGQRILLDRPSEPVSAWFWSTLLIVGLALLLRLEVNQPVHSERGLQIMKRILFGKLSYAAFLWLPVYVLTFLLVLADSSSTFYAVIGISLKELWAGLFNASFWFMLLGVWCLLLAFYFLSRISSPLRPISEYAKRFLSKPLSFVGMVRKNGRAILVLAIVISLGVIVSYSDAEIGLFTPRIEYAETRLDYSYGVIGTVNEYSTVIHVWKTYFISSPYIWLIRNITIANPSNYSYSQGAGWGTISWSSIGSEKDVGLSAVRGADNRILGFNITLHPEPYRYNLALKTDYYDKLSYPIINSTFVETDVGNNTIRREYHITIENPFMKRLDFQTLFLVDTPTPITNLTCSANGKMNANLCGEDESARYLYIRPDSLEPGNSLNLVVIVEFKRL